ncbi:MAG: hypothetical protein AAF267_07155 [Deinococcota bacterium]
MPKIPSGGGFSPSFFVNILYTNRDMHLIALLCQDDQLSRALSEFHDVASKVILHPVPYLHDLERVLASLEPLDFAGALILSASLQERAFSLSSRSSLDAQEAAAADSVTVTPGSLVAEYNLGRAVGLALQHIDWDARGARAVVLGSGPMGRAVARDLASSGVRHLSVLGTNRPEAEQTASQLAITTDVVARAQDDPLAFKLLDGADLLVRIDTSTHIPTRHLGPHLTVVDLAPQAMSPLRQRATNLGAVTLGARDIQAQQVALCLNHILGSTFDAGQFLSLIHGIGEGV